MFAIASYTDLKNRIISNKITFSLIAIGFLGNGFLAIYFGTIISFFYMCVATLGMFIASYFLYKFKYWGGGDAKLITGIFICNPFPVGYLTFAFSMISHTVLSFSIQKNTKTAPFAPVLFVSYLIAYLIFENLLK